MMYYLHLLSEQIKGFNVFSYVTFRAVAAAVTAFVLSLAFGNFVIRKLIALKIGQPIRTAEEVHRLAELHSAKKGIPTMGGVLVIGTVVLSSFLWARPTIASSGSRFSAWFISASSVSWTITSRSRRRNRTESVAA